MQKGNLWHFGNAFSCSAGSESSMTFSPNLPKFDRMTQGEGIPTNLKVKGVLCMGLSKAKNEVLFTLESCCNFLLDYSRGSGWRRSQHSTWAGEKQGICQDTKTQGEQGNWAVSWAVPKGTEKLWSSLWNVLSHGLSFPIYAVKKKKHHPKCKLLVKDFACLQTKAVICPSSQHSSTPAPSTQCFNLTAAIGAILYPERLSCRKTRFLSTGTEFPFFQVFPSAL